LTINGKNYRNGRHHSYCYYDGEHWHRNKYTLMHGHRKAKLILALVGLKLKKYIELREKGAAENYSGPDRGRCLIASVGRV